MDMSNWQLFVSAGLPTLAVIVSIGRTDKRLDRMDARFDGMDRRLDGMDSKMEHLHENLVGRIDRVQENLVARIDRVADNLHDIQLALGRHDARLDNLEKK